MATTILNQVQPQNNNVNKATSNPQVNVANVQPVAQQGQLAIVQPVSNASQLQTISTVPTQNVANNTSYNVPIAVQYTPPTSNTQAYQAQIQNVYDNYKPQYDYESNYPEIQIPTANDNTIEGQFKGRYADAANQLLNQLLKERFSYNPNEDDLLKQATQYTTQNTMESMNSRGLLNSSLTAERVARVVGELIPTYEKMARDEFDANFTRLANTINLLGSMDDREFARWQDARNQKWKEEERDYQRKLDELEIAWKRVDELGYVDNEAAVVLGVAAGTLSKDAREAKIEKQTEKELLQFKQELEKDMYSYQSNLDTQRQKELYAYQSNLETNSYEKQLQLQKKYSTSSSSSSSSSTSNRNEVESVLLNRWGEKGINDNWTLTDNNSAYDYLISAYTSSQITDNDLSYLTSKYGIKEPVEIVGTVIKVRTPDGNVATLDTRNGVTREQIISWARSKGVDITKYLS